MHMKNADCKEVRERSSERSPFFPNLDYAKLIMALLVVEIHTKPFMSLGSPVLNRIVEGVDCVAVPFFFIASGFLCFKSIDASELRDRCPLAALRIIATIKKLLLLYVIWFIIYLPIDLFGSIEAGNGLAKAIALEVRGFVFVGEGYFSWPLWYLLASAVAFAIIYFLSKYMRVTSILAMSFLMLIIGFAIGEINNSGVVAPLLSPILDAYFLIFGNVRNGLFEGFFYVSLGALLGTIWKPCLRIPAPALLGMVFGGALGCILITPSAHLPFCIVFSLGLFLMAIRKTDQQQRLLAVISRNASTVVYLVHMLFVVAFVYGILGWSGEWGTLLDYPHAILYIFALSSSFAITLVAIPLARRYRLVKTVFGI